MPYALGDYRRRLGHTAGYSLQLTTTSGSARADQVVCSILQSTEYETTFLGNTWLYEPTGPNAGQCVRIQYQSGLDPSTGTIQLERPFPSITPINTPIEIYGRLPPVDYEGRLGLNSIVNRVLDECWTVTKISLPAVQDAQFFFSINTPTQPLPPAPPLPIYPWLVSEDQVTEMYMQPANFTVGNPHQIVNLWKWCSNADNPLIYVPSGLNNGDQLLPEVYMPMSWWTFIDPMHGWAMPTTSGLQNETDQALLSLPGMEAVGKAYVYDELAKWGLPDDQNRYEGLRVKARAAANEWKRLSLERPPRRARHWMTHLTIPSRWSYGYGFYVAPWG